MQIGKYIINLGVIGALLNAFGVAKKTREMPEDWRRYLVWGTWLISLTMAISSVAMAESDEDFIQDKKAQKKEQKKIEKALKKAEM